MDAVILLNKPAGMTSFDAVRKCRRICNEKKIGHTGTLDPEASGLMIILLGRYTKMLPFCVKDHKAYHASFSLGKKTETEDIWGKVVAEKEYREHDDEELRQTAQAFTGMITQIPPMYSAIKHNGRRLYEYAREGIEVERQPRQAEVSFLECHHTGENTYSMDAVVSSGTYIRTLITDFCNALGEYGTMTSLKRTAIEHLTLKQACTLEELSEEIRCTDPFEVLSPEYEVVESNDLKRIGNGMRIRMDGHSDKVIFAHDGKILAAYEKRNDGLYHCQRGLF